MCARGTSLRRRICCGCVNPRRRLTTTRAPGSSFLRIRRFCFAAACCTKCLPRHRFRRPPSRSPSRTARLRRSVPCVPSSRRQSGTSGTRSHTGRNISRRECVMGASSTTWDDTRKRRKNCAGRLRTVRAISFCISPQLFLGRAEEALEHGEAARVAFERASALYPNAQSPRLALSQIARRAGNRPAAQRELQVISALPDDQRRREDPWWFYYDVR